MFNNPRFLVCGTKSACYTYLVAELEKLGSVTCLTPENFNLTNPGSCAAYVSLFKPDCLINLVLSHDSNKPDSRITTALLHSMIGTDSLFVQFSDVSIFSGDKGESYNENDLPDSANHDGLQEIVSEQLLNQEFIGTLIIRSGVLHSQLTPNFITEFMQSCIGKRHMTINVGNVISLISARLAGKLTADLIKKAFADKSVRSVFNLACIGTPTEGQVISFALDTAKRLRPDLKWPKLSIRDKSQSNKNFSYDCRRFQESTYTILPDWQDGVIETVSGFLATKI